MIRIIIDDDCFFSSLHMIKQQQQKQQGTFKDFFIDIGTHQTTHTHIHTQRESYMKREK